MKLIIDIPYGLKDVYEHGNVTALDVEEMKRALQNGTPIPDNATNGDVMDIVFADDEDMRINTDKHGFVHIRGVKSEWLDAPYKKGGKE